MEEWQVQSASSIISKAFEIKEYAIAPKAVRYEIASGNLREDFPSIVRKLEAMDMGASAEYLNGGLVILVYDARVYNGALCTPSYQVTLECTILLSPMCTTLFALSVR